MPSMWLVAINDPESNQQSLTSDAAELLASVPTLSRCSEKTDFARRSHRPQPSSKQLSYRSPADTLLRLRRGSKVFIKMPADGLENARE